MFEEVMKVRLGEPDGFYLNEDSNLYSAFDHNKQYGKRDLDFTAASLLSLNTNTNGYSSSYETHRQGRFHRRTSSIILNSILVPSTKESSSSNEYLIDSEREEKGATNPRARPSFAGSCSSNTTRTSESCSSERSSNADIEAEPQQLVSTGVEDSEYLLSSFKPVRIGRSVNRYNSLEWLDMALSTPSTGQQTNRLNTTVGQNSYTVYNNFNSSDHATDFPTACQSYLNIHQNQPAEEIELNCVSSAFLPVQYHQDSFNDSILRFNTVKPCTRVGVNHPVSPLSINSSTMGSNCSGECECEEENCDMDHKVMVNDGMMYVCGKNSCQQRFDSENSLVKHERIHSSLKNKTRDYKCVHCDKAFYTKSCLKSHEKIHTREPNSYICRIENCGKTYCTKEGLRLHTRNHHDLDKKWTCPAPFCSKSFVRQSDMRLHIMRIHSSKRPYPCTLAGCKKSFACISELRRHQNSHDRKKRKLEMKIKKEEPSNKKPKLI